MASVKVALLYVVIAAETKQLNVNCVKTEATLLKIL